MKKLKWLPVLLAVLLIPATAMGIIGQGMIGGTGVDTILSIHIKDGTIDSADYAAGSIDAEHLAADVIDETKIADNGIDSEHYNDGSVDLVHLAADTKGITLDSLDLTLLTAEPTEVVGKIYLANNSDWDPCDIAGTDDYFVVCTAAGAPGTYRAFLTATGAIPISSVALPSYTHFATGDAVYNDTSTPHVLTTEECKNGLITNADAGEDRVYTFPAAEMGFNLMAMVVEAFQMDLEPDGTETLWLNGTQMAQGEHIINAADTKGDVISCWSAETGDGTYEIFCKSDNTNWAEATP